MATYLRNKMGSILQAFCYYLGFSNHLEDASPPLIDKLESAIQELIEVTDYSNLRSRRLTERKAAKVIHLIYWLSLEETEISETKKAILGNLLKQVIWQLKFLFRSEFYRTRSELDTGVIHMRSAADYLLKVMGQYPAGDSTLSKALEEAQFEESVRYLDQIIYIHQEYSSSESDSANEVA